ncbi:MAG: hypothetical protein EA398_12065 [Deltaproteobacteria bacterium]|nr:MAG: hypothetical protein EA398_12065 [Deltaproteobacteria bacterium]
MRLRAGIPTPIVSLAWAVVLGMLAGCSGSPGDADAGSDATDPPGCTGAECPPDTGGPSGTAPAIGCTTADDCPSPDQACDVARQRCVPRCTSDDGCDPRASCDLSQGICTPRPPCGFDDRACPDGLACDACLGACLPDPGGTACLDDANCGFDEFCEPCMNLCEPRRPPCAPCRDDLQCGESGDLCLDFAEGGRYCGRACGSCPVGYDCDPGLGQCVPLSGSCEVVRECSRDADCLGALICGAAGLCVPGCTDDSACEGSLVCSAGRCTEPCATDGDCAAGQECRDDQRCWVPGGCFTSVDCPEAETYCDREAGLCVSGCQVDVDCLDASQECVSGVCVRRRCAGNYACAFQEVCDLDSGQCRPDERPHCSGCDAGDVDSCGSENICVELEDEPTGSCFLRCDDDPLNDCPQGYRCTEVEVNEQPRRVCFRPRCDDPV